MNTNTIIDEILNQELPVSKEDAKTALKLVMDVSDPLRHSEELQMFGKALKERDGSNLTKHTKTIFDLILAGHTSKVASELSKTPYKITTLQELRHGLLK